VGANKLLLMTRRSLPKNHLILYNLITNHLEVRYIEEGSLLKNDEIYTIAGNIRILSVVITKLARQETEQRFEQVGIDLKAVQYWALRLMGTYELTLADLSRKMRLDPSSLVPVVDTLERKGLVKREQDPRDRRCTPLKLTPAGADLLARVSLLESESALVKSLSRMEAQQRQQLLDLLSQFVMHLSDDEELIAFCQSLRGKIDVEPLNASE
jgi:DNA-binding MarR family transcriptional regulator